MEEKRRVLTVYRIRDQFEGITVKKFEDVIVNNEELSHFNLLENQDYEAQLYLSKTVAKKPPWVDFLETGFGELEEINSSEKFSAALVVKIIYDKPIFYALTFGAGRFLLKTNSYIPNFGLKTTLNAIYQAEDSTKEIDTVRIRTIDAKTVSANTMYTHRQVDHKTTFDTFGVDVQSDILKGITGNPNDVEIWGTRVSGKDAFHLNPFLSIEKIGALCKEIEKLYQSTYYKERFSWVDNVTSISNKDLIEDLEAVIEKNLKEKNTENLELALPEIVEWDTIAFFKFSFASDEEFCELEISSYLNALEKRGKTSELSIKQLRFSQKVDAIDGEGQLIKRWPIFKCISGEVRFNDKTYLINEGSFFEVKDDYLEELNNFIESLKESETILPPSEIKMDEGEYNKFAANSSNNFLLLDKKTVRVNTKTTPIEICDIFSYNRSFIHIKRKLGSSSLSHLFGQGYVSGDLFLMNQEYRENTLKIIKKEEKEREQNSGKEDFVGRFSTFNISAISPQDFEIVYAIIANWNGRNLVSALPFFSKVNLRRYVVDLKRMGYNVSYLRIPIS